MQRRVTLIFSGDMDRVALTTRSSKVSTGGAAGSKGDIGFCQASDELMGLGVRWLQVR